MEFLELHPWAFFIYTHSILFYLFKRFIYILMGQGSLLLNETLLSKKDSNTKAFTFQSNTWFFFYSWRMRFPNYQNTIKMWENFARKRATHDPAKKKTPHDDFSIFQKSVANVQIKKREIVWYFFSLGWHNSKRVIVSTSGSTRLNLATWNAGERLTSYGSSAGYR